MFIFSTESFREHIKSDNRESLAICDDLAAALQVSLELYPKDENILGVYFFDVLKLLTGSYFKHKEIRLGIEPSNEYLNRKLDGWPYIGYDDIAKGCDLGSKRFGKVSSIKQSILKRFLQRSINTQYDLGRQFSKRIALTSPRIAYGESLLWRQSPQLKTNLITANKGWFSVRALYDQLESIRSIVIEVMEKNNHPVSSTLIVELLLNHIKADCFEGPVDFKFESDILLLTSGIDLHNRMLSMAAVSQGLPVINIMHGEAWGILDEPPFSELGEHTYSNAILGYGDGAVPSQKKYKYGLSQKIHYINSNGSNVKRFYKNEFKGVNSALGKLNYFYYPTTLSGATHRYGPYRDTADSLYLSWQQNLFDLFKTGITVKCHPKEKYASSYASPSVSLVSGSFDVVLNDIDVFVFDYIGTAFHEACATDKPVIFFDLGIRNIAPDVLEAIKVRTVYFNIDDGMPLLSEIEDRIAFAKMNNTYSTKYSLCGDNKSRSQSLSEGIDKFYG